MNRFLICCTAAFTATLFCTAAFASPRTESSAPAKQLSLSDSGAKSDSSLSGKVVEAMNSGGYTYVCLEKNGVKTWVAVPEMKVTVGQKMSFQPGGEMKNFTSKTLNKTFDTIIFSNGPISPSGSAKASPMKRESSSSAAASGPIKVEKAEGVDACTVAEVYAKKASLNKKKVSVHGKVVKVSTGIMGKNWIHIQDGSGSAEKGTNNLVVTTHDMAAVGDVVTIKGTLYKDKDFGGGYKYAVIVEEASVEP
jgi:hypothetical protein